MQLVQRATWNCITLAPGAEANIEKLTTGIFDSAINLLKVQLHFASLTCFRHPVSLATCYVHLPA